MPSRAWPLDEALQAADEVLTPAPMAAASRGMAAAGTAQPPWSLLRMLALCLLLLAAMTPAANAITAEEATRVGGDLSQVGRDINAFAEQLAAFRGAIAKIVDAAPQVDQQVMTALQKIPYSSI